MVAETNQIGCFKDYMGLDTSWTRELLEEEKERGTDITGLTNVGDCLTKRQVWAQNTGCFGPHRTYPYKNLLAANENEDRFPRMLVGCLPILSALDKAHSKDPSLHIDFCDGQREHNSSFTHISPPASVSPQEISLCHWTWTLPWPVAFLQHDPLTKETQCTTQIQGASCHPCCLGLWSQCTAGLFVSGFSVLWWRLQLSF